MSARSAASCPGWVSRAWTPLVRRLTVVSCPAMSSTNAMPRSSSDESRSPSSAVVRMRLLSRSSAGPARRLSSIKSVRQAAS